MKIFSSLLARLKEPSTWAGVGILLQVVKQVKPEYSPVIELVESHLPKPETVAQTVSNYDIGSMGAGLLSIFLAEKSKGD